VRLAPEQLSCGPTPGGWFYSAYAYAALGADVASIDYGASTDFIVHRIAAAAGVLGLENLANLSALPPSGATMIALPIKIENGSGGPVRAIALIPR